MEEPHQIFYDSLKQKADGGDPEAQCAIGDMCADDSRAAFFNINEAVSWYEKAAAQGHTRAQWLLGASYFHGIGVEKNADKAEYWLTKSAQSGDADGQYALGAFYFSKPDIVKTKYWIAKAAEQNHEEAKTMLAAVNKLLEMLF